MPCTTCHVVPAATDDPGHLDGDNKAELSFDVLNPTATFDAASSTCANLYCHGNGRGNNGTMVFTAVGTLGCADCHLAPNPGQSANGMSGAHSKHIRGENLQCVACHAGVVDAARNVIAGALHVNGQRNVSFANGGTWDPATQNCTNTGCHGRENWQDD